MTRKIDTYFSQGCGRCPLGLTPDCVAKKWQRELETLRTIILECQLTEELKWGVPCYMHGKSNIVLMSALKEYCALSFFKGALMNDPEGILKKPGENTQAARLIQFTDVKEIVALEPVLKAYINEAIELEKAGLKVDFNAKSQLVYPEELQAKLDEFPAFGEAFAALTPGKQRGYVLHFSAPKLPKTRESRVEKCIQQILDGKGIHDTYRSMGKQSAS